MKTKIYILLFFCTLSLSLAMPLYATKHIVHVGSFYFNPSSLNVAVGDTLRWVWDGGSHTTTSTTIPTGAATWDSPINSSITSFEYKVTVAGLHNYVCTPHAGMGQVGNFTAAAASPTLSVSPSTRNVGSQAGSTTFNVTSNSNWTATCNMTWCAVTSSGSGNGTINADFTENTSVTPRSATITVSVSGLPSQTVTVNQSGAAPFLSVTPPTQSVNASSGSVNFNISTNTNWTASSNAAWCTVTSSGGGSGVLTANYQQNSSFVSRTASITVTVAGFTPQIVTVTQDASTVGFRENEQNSVQVYPNPTTGIFKVKGDINPSAVLDISVIDVCGNVLQKKNCQGTDEYTFDLSKAPRGVYFVRINEDTKSIVKRVLLVGN